MAIQTLDINDFITKHIAAGSDSPGENAPGNAGIRDFPGWQNWSDEDKWSKIINTPMGQGANGDLWYSSAPGKVSFDDTDPRLSANMNESIIGDLLPGLSVIAMFAGPALMSLSGPGSSFSSWASETMNGWGESIEGFFGAGSDAAGSGAAELIGDAAADTLGSAANTGVQSIIENSTGLNVNPADALQATTSTTGDFIGLAPTQNIGLGSATGPSVFNGAASGASLAQDNGGGIINSILNWGKNNQGLASGLINVVGGALKGMGDRETALEMTDRKIAGDMALLDRRTQEQIELDNAKRAAVQSGSYFDAKTNIRPGDNVLRRPDGSLVYGGGGLINSQMA